MKRFCLSLLLLSVVISTKAQLPQVYLFGSFGYEYQEGEMYIVDSDTTKFKINMYDEFTKYLYI